MVKKHPPIKHIWFDFAGTLYQEAPELRTALRQHAYKTYASVLDMIDMERAKKEYDELYLIQGSNSAAFRSLGKPDNYWQNSVDEFNRTSFFHPEDEVIHTLSKLHNKVPISLFTNFKRTQIEVLLAHLRIPEADFTWIISGDDVSSRKPALDGFYMMIEKSGLPAENLIYVGDREMVDIVPAHTVGMQTCMLYGESMTADYVFHSFKDLLSLVAKKV